MNGFTRENYPQLLAYRNEGLKKYGARFTDEITRPPSRCFLPAVWSVAKPTAFPSVAIGPLRVGAAGPSMILAHEALAKRAQVKVLDIGCAAGMFRDYLLLRDRSRAIEYVGVDVAPQGGDFPVYASLDEVPGRRFDLIFMSEVAEHMPADVFLRDYLAKLPRLMSPQGLAIAGVPNPLAPTVLQRDVTHVQHYPWFDLYAMFRFFFDDVDVVRTHFIHTPRRLLSLPLRVTFSYFLEMDWCEGITLLARRPRA